MYNILICHLLVLSSDFGGIFAELLLGNFAKLQPPEGQDLMDGVKTSSSLILSFGESGGQGMV